MPRPPGRAERFLHAVDVVDELLRKPQGVIRNVVSQALWPQVHAVRQLQVAVVSLVAESTRRVSHVGPGNDAVAEVRHNKIALLLIQGGIHERCRVRIVPIGEAVAGTPVSNPPEEHRKRLTPAPGLRRERSNTYPSARCAVRLRNTIEQFRYRSTWAALPSFT